MLNNYEQKERRVHRFLIFNVHGSFLLVPVAVALIGFLLLDTPADSYVGRFQLFETNLMPQLPALLVTILCSLVNSWAGLTIVHSFVSREHMVGRAPFFDRWFISEHVHRLLGVWGASYLATIVACVFFIPPVFHEGNPAFLLGVFLMTTLTITPTCLLFTGSSPRSAMLPTIVTSVAVLIVMVVVLLGHYGVVLRANALNMSGEEIQQWRQKTVGNTYTIVFIEIVLGATTSWLWLRFIDALWVIRQVRVTRQQLAHAAVDSERIRFGRDLHDHVGRVLATIALKSELAQAQLAQAELMSESAQAELMRGESTPGELAYDETGQAGPVHDDATQAEPAEAQVDQAGASQAEYREQLHSVAENLAAIRRLAVNSQQTTRELVRGYRTIDFAAELDGAKDMLQAASIRMTTTITTEPIPQLVLQTFAWVLRESATNVLRHSRASEVKVCLRSDAGFQLEIRNDGIDSGNSPESEDSRDPMELHGGQGIAGLHERMRAIGGELTIDRSASEFILIATVPTLAAESLRAAESAH